MKITEDQITELRTEAGEHGDLDMVAICDRAIDGDRTARERCAEVISDALAMNDS